MGTQQRLVFVVCMKKFCILATYRGLSVESDQNVQLERLIWVFAGCTCHFVMLWLQFLLGLKVSLIMRKPALSHMQSFVNNGADQPGHPCSLISTFVVPSLDIIIPVVAMYEISRLRIPSFCSWAGRFECYLAQNSWRQVFLWCGSSFPVNLVSPFSPSPQNRNLQQVEPVLH